MTGSRNLVWLASYPKSGNTWVRLLLGNLLNLKDDAAEPDDLNPVSGITSARWPFELIAGVSTFDLTPEEIDRLRPDVYREIARADPELTFLKAHDAYQQNGDGQPIFPADCSRAAIYLVRNPLDVAVSYSHHLGNLSFERTVAIMQDDAHVIGGKNKDQIHQFVGRWSDHYRSWTQQTAIPVIVIKYEDLRSDTVKELKRIADFAGLQESEFAMSFDDAALASRFDKLRKIEAQKGFAEKPRNSDQFFRSGRSGEGREKLSLELQTALISGHTEVMQELGYI